MSSGFRAAPAREDLLGELERLAPSNPFATAAFSDARRRLGQACWVLGVSADVERFDRACAAFLEAGRLNRTLEIPSLPDVAENGVFWSGLARFCREQRVTRVELGSFGSPPGTRIPAFGAVHARRARCEFVTDLGRHPVAPLSSNHRRNVRRAEAAGLLVRRARSAEAVSVHASLMGQSLDRRRARGEHVEHARPSKELTALVEAGAAELFQAQRGGIVFSSVLVLRAVEGGYYHSAGTSPEGMEAGASHFLIHAIAHELRAAGARLFNLGGADADSSLARFKRGFGADPVPLEAASAYVGALWRRELRRALDLARRAQAAGWRSAIESITNAARRPS